MSVHFFNTLTRSLEEFRPQVEGKVRLYTCGPTVHDFAHIGNFRTYVFEDLLRRYLKFRGYEVVQVMNLTDVEDKIIRKSEEAGIHFKEYTGRYTEAFFQDLKTLNIEPAEHYPRATDHIEGMVEMIRDLLAKGIAYRSEDGSIYFDISKFPGYGKLANIQVEELACGVRICQDEYEKESACDFALWKAWCPEDGHVYWDQYPDLGKGRPGWHIECSAMSRAFLGDSFDIHCGGVDNIFPHHQNEIAQSEAFSGKKFVEYWLHSEHLQVESSKMSKSLGNFITLRDLLEADRNPSQRAYDPMVIRYALISVPYRSRLNFRYDGLQAAEKSLERILAFLRRCQEQRSPSADGQVLAAVEAAHQGFVAALDQDLQIAEGLARIFEWIHQVNRRMDELGDIGESAGQACLSLWSQFDQVLGLQLLDRLQQGPLAEEIERLIEERNQARRDKNFARADQIRAQLSDQGVVLEDTPQGVRWKRNP